MEESPRRSYCACVDRFIRHFTREADGIWRCEKAGELILPEGRVQVVPGSVFVRGTRFMNLDLAALLDEHYTKLRSSGRR